MPFSTEDRQRLINALNLPKSQAIDNSVLATLMTQAEQFDADNGTDFVTRIQDRLDEIEGSLKTAVTTAQASSGIQSINYEGDVSKSYFSANSGTSVAISNMEQAKDDIKTWLDEDGLLESYYLDGRVIPTL